MINKHCPSCSEPLPLLSGKTLVCDTCKKKLVAKDGGALFVVVAIVLFTPFKLLGLSLVMADSVIDVILIFAGILIAAFVVKHLTINYKVASSD